MPVVDVIKDLDARTLQIRARFAAPVERVWELYADLRQLEQVWGPPTYPATFVEHALSQGSRSTYFMTGPEGDTHAGWWRITAVKAPEWFAFDDGFAHEDFTDNDALPVSHSVYRFESDGDGTLATLTTAYDSVDALQQVLDMGMEEGATLAINQIDDVLTAA